MPSRAAKQWRAKIPPRCCASVRRRITSDQGKRGADIAGSSSSLQPRDLDDVLQEVKALQALIKEQQALTRSVSSQTAQVQTRLTEIENHMSKISALKASLTKARDAVQKNPALRPLVENLERLVKQSTPIVRDYKYYILGIAVAMVVVWENRSMFYQSTSEEVADLARRTLEQDSLRQSIQETIQTVANNPSTLRTLNDLVQKLVTHEQTEKDLVNLVVHAVNTPEVQKALLDLLAVVFQDPSLQHLAAEFLLKGLDMDSVKKMLDSQTQELVKVTVKDDAVQQATAIGIHRSLLYTITPSFLWRFIEHDKHVSEASTESVPEVPKDGSSQ
eukprot:Sro1381_g267830.2  (332) ;mRNA; f:16469-17464